MDGETPMTTVRHDPSEGPPVLAERDGRAVVRAYNQAGHDFTEVDVLDLVAWLRANRPDLLAGVTGAERERCALVAEEESALLCCDQDSIQYRVGHHIAKAIREGKE